MANFCAVWVASFLLVGTFLVVIRGQQTTGGMQTCTYSFLVANGGQGPQSSCSNSPQIKDMQDQLSSLQQQVQNLQKATASGNRGRVNVTVKKPSFNCKCGANATVDVVYRDCEDIAELLEAAVPGVYTVEPVTTTGRLVSVQDQQGRKDQFWLVETAAPVQVLCDIDDLGIAWTVLMRRKNFDVNFNRTWNDYKMGFGDMTSGGDFWLGLEKMHLMTNQRFLGFTLWIIMYDERDLPQIAAYGRFSVGPETEGYRIHLNDYHGQLEDAMRGDRSNMNVYQSYGPPPSSDRTPGLFEFETKDRVPDTGPLTNRSCTLTDKVAGGGWWFARTSNTGSYYNYGCGKANLNAGKPRWGNLVAKQVEMRMRPNF